MKAQNNKELTTAMITFSLFLLASVALAVGSFSFFVKTASVELNKIIEKTGDYDLIQIRQIHLTERMDTIYHYSTLLNSEIGINYSGVYNLLGSRGMQLENELESMNPADCFVYKKISGQLTTFFAVKDSIKRTTLELEGLREEYIKCMNRNKELSKQLYTSGIY